MLSPRIVTIPLLDDQRRSVERWVALLDQRRLAVVRREIRRILPDLQKVNGSWRHRALAEYLRSADISLDTRETQGARYILLTALSVFECRPNSESDTGVSVRSTYRTK